MARTSTAPDLTKTDDLKPLERASRSPIEQGRLTPAPDHRVRVESGLAANPSLTPGTARLIEERGAKVSVSLALALELRATLEPVYE